ncbi:MAG: ankyrin repeat domain-containing protein [Vicinamibacterales bacterium]
MAAPADHPVLYAIFGLNRAGQILYGALIVLGFAGFVGWTMLPGLSFTDQDEALFRAARHGDRAGVERALAAGGSLVHEAPIDHKTALFRAAVFGHADVVRLLLERGADPNALGADGRSALAVVTAAREEEKDPAAAQALDAVAAVLREKAASP